MLAYLVILDLKTSSGSSYSRYTDAELDSCRGLLSVCVWRSRPGGRAVGARPHACGLPAHGTADRAMLPIAIGAWARREPETNQIKAIGSLARERGHSNPSPATAQHGRVQLGKASE